MLNARTEAHDEVEAAAEQRCAAALALERAEADKQARSLTSMQGAWLHRLGPLCRERVCNRLKKDGCACHACVAAWHMWH